MLTLAEKDNAMQEKDNSVYRTGFLSSSPITTRQPFKERQKLLTLPWERKNAKRKLQEQDFTPTIQVQYNLVTN